MSFVELKVFADAGHPVSLSDFTCWPCKKIE